MFEKRTKRKWHGRQNNFQTVCIRNVPTLARKNRRMVMGIIGTVFYYSFIYTYV